MTDCGFSVIELEMATSRDDQSARVTKKDLKDVQCTDTTKKDRQDGISNQPSKTRASTLQLDLVCQRAASSDSVSVSSLHRAKPQRSYRALKLSSDLPSHASKPNAATCFHIVAWSRCFVPRWLGLSAPLPCDIYIVYMRAYFWVRTALLSHARDAQSTLVESGQRVRHNAVQVIQGTDDKEKNGSENNK